MSQTSPPSSRTFADVAQTYLERHVQRHLVPRACQLAQYAHTFLATVQVPAPEGGTVPFPDKAFEQITTDDVEQAIEAKALEGTKIMSRRGYASWTRRVGGGHTANRLHAHLRSLWRWAITKGYTDTTPFARAGLPTLRMRPEHARERRFVGEEGPRLLGVRPSNRRDNHISSCRAPVLSVTALGDGPMVDLCAVVPEEGDDRRVIRTSDTA